MSKDNFPSFVLNMIKQRSGLCIGLDPSRQTLSDMGFSDNLQGLQDYCKIMVEVCIQSNIGFVKPQSAFFEVFGWRGLQILSETCYQLRSEGILLILDCKRGDIGTTSMAYADAYLSDIDLSKFNFITVNPFLGYESLVPFVDVVKSRDVGFFVLIRTSNPESYLFQEALLPTGKSISLWLAKKIKEDNDLIFGESKQGCIGAVVGSTLEKLDTLLNEMPTSFFLCPGIGAQGATINSALKKFSGYLPQCIFPISRGITQDYDSKKKLISKIETFRKTFEITGK